MSVALGLLLGLGIVLALSPALWPAPDTAATPPRLARLLRERLAQAGLQFVSLPALAAAAVLAAVASSALVFALVPVLAIAVIAGGVALVLPLSIVGWRARNRRRRARVVWPDVVDHLVSAVRSGLALPDSVVALAHSGPPLTREQFAAFEREYRATGNFALCADSLKASLADPVADRILETLRMSREVGGSELTTVLRSLAGYLRAEAAIRSEVEARQSWVLNAAKLGVASPWVILLLLSTRPEAAAAYNTPGGIVVIVAGLAVTAVAYRAMLALARLPEERRWFS
ncbi:type II secretion system F family protein [Lacisediminihabitans sp.]|uniref:type II secretion system F family protein n=1 Tax=Lacisediminihabitans sp. TaxID=2787631 RepID=UPI00374D40E0